MLKWCCVVASAKVPPAFCTEAVASQRPVGGADAVGVHAGAVADAAGARAPVAEMQRHDVVGLAGEDPDGRRRGSRPPR